jgi:hypothetical protein
VPAKQEPVAGMIAKTGKPRRVLRLLLWGAHNPLIRRYFLGVFRFAQMVLADGRNPTQANNKGKQE